MIKENLLKIIIDTRERKLIDIFDKRKDILSYSVEQLDIADVIIYRSVFY